MNASIPATAGPARRRAPAVALLAGTLIGVAALSFSSCSGGSSGDPADPGEQGVATLQRVDYGRLVDIYAYRRIDGSIETRRDTANRRPTLIARDVVVDPNLETDPLFDSSGGERFDADYRFLSFDVAVGHDELLILWDDQNPEESGRFQSALNAATGNLVEMAAAYRGQNVLVRPIPVIPRNCALKLTFDADLGQDEEFYRINPAVIQVLQFRNDPDVVSAAAAFTPADVRIVPQGNELIVDLTIIGGETAGIGRSTTGLDPSPNNIDANYRLAIPTTGVNGRLLDINPDDVAEQNDIDSFGDQSVIRDFRSGNANDVGVGSLGDFEPPMLITSRSMTVLEVDAANQRIRISKRGADLPIRGRVPFVDGALDSNRNNLPGGPGKLPVIDGSGVSVALPHGDFVTQTVLVPVPGTSEFEAVRIRAEVVWNEAVGRLDGDANFVAPGLTATGTDGGEIDEVWLRLSTVQGVDSRGNVVTMEASTPERIAAADVTVRYYEFLRYRADPANLRLSDAGRRGQFFEVSPTPVDMNGDPIPPSNNPMNVAPASQFGLRFSEPLDLRDISAADNFVLTTTDVTESNFQDVFSEPKGASLTVQQADLIDVRGDGSFLRLSPRLGLFHEQGTAEQYWTHLDASDVGGPRDLSGNRIELFDLAVPSQRDPLDNFSVPFTLMATAEDNLVASRVIRFADADEDGSTPGSLDFFGQFQLVDGELRGAAVSRRSRTADDQNIGSILRFDKGECVVPGDPAVPTLPTSVGPAPAPPRVFSPGVLYEQPSILQTAAPVPRVFQPPVSQPYGGVVEPHTSRGARMQMTYREDDFGLSYTSANDLNIDVEQLHWAPWNDEPVLFDSFDRYTMALGHGKRRPDLLFRWFEGNPGPPEVPPECTFDCLSLFSGLEQTFVNNVLPTSSTVEVVKDKEWVINPNDAFLADSGVKYVPYPEFATTFTWRDSRIVSVDENGQATGLGGAQDAISVPPDGDRTASVSSPWVPDDPATAWIAAFGGPDMMPPAGNDPADWAHSIVTRDTGDFLGDRTLDHDPIALPLLVDISVWPDDSVQVANAGNQFHIATVGPFTPIAPFGYYNIGGGGYNTTVRAPDLYTCTNIDWPFFRVYSVGGEDLNSPGRVNLVDPDLAQIARGGVIKDKFLGDADRGLFQTKPGDSSLHWAQIDLVRRVSVVTFGFFDTLRPNQHALSGSGIVPGSLPALGRPDFTTISPDLGVSDLAVVFDPPLTQQPGGTSLTIELRGADSFDNDDLLYDQAADDGLFTRGNLLNPNYASDAYRLAMNNPGDPSGAAAPGVIGIEDPRINAAGLTRYVLPDRLNDIRNPINNRLPRFMNMRLVMENNISSNPTLAPRVRTLSLVYRVGATN